ncbi:MAG: dihydrolipoyllysine-residue acetyltransferase [Ignavibacteriales bacterium]|nr:dihydrolipoyllysine-residue acetyltransferase [Ignavibacteriales bacterium]
MQKEFKLPDLGESIVSATVVKVLIAPGDMVKEDQTVLEIETDKATIEVPSEISGKVTGVYIKEGQKVEVGAVVFSVESGTEKQSVEVKAVKVTESQSQEVTEKPAKSVKTEDPVVEAASAQPPAAEPVSSVQEIILPDLGDTIESALVVKVTVKVGDSINEDDTILEIETDKATVEVPSPTAGVISEVLVKEGEKAKVGSVIFKLEAKSAGAPAVVKTSSEDGQTVKSETTTPALSAEEIAELKEEMNNPEVAVAPPKALVDLQPPILQNSAPAAPSVRRLAREIGVDINQVKGSGPRGRINLDDVKSFSKALHEGRVTSPQALKGEGSFLAQKPLPDFSKFGEIERKGMNNIRTKTAEHLSYAWATIPHVTQFDKADITDLEQLRKKFAPEVAKSAGKLTMTSILVKVVTAAMKHFPQFNSSIDMEKKEIVYKNYFNIGIAVDTEFGLIVPNIKGTDKLNLTQISVEMNVISEKARNKKIGLDDLQGGCFTISNLGGIGGTYFTPIVNSPEVAILGVSRGTFEPVYKDGEFVPRLMLPLSLSSDHRVIDGADAIRFLRWVIDTLENPFKLLIEG